MNKMNITELTVHELLEKLKAVYDWAILADILNGQEYISFSKVDVYEKHGRDLKTLKEYVIKYQQSMDGR